MNRFSVSRFVRLASLSALLLGLPAALGSVAFAQSTGLTGQVNLPVDLPAASLKLRLPDNTPLLEVDLPQDGTFNLTLPSISPENVKSELFEGVGVRAACDGLPMIPAQTAYLQVLDKTARTPLGFLEFTERGPRNGYLQLSVLTFLPDPVEYHAEKSCGDVHLTVDLNMRAGWNLVTFSAEQEKGKEIELSALDLVDPSVNFVPQVK